MLNQTDRMRKFTLLVTFALALAVESQACAGDIVGRVADGRGRAVPGVQVLVKNSSGAIVGRGVSDVNGNYAVRAVSPGTYTLTSKGQSASTYVGPDAVSVNWGASGIAPPTALAQPGTATQTSIGVQGTGSSVSVRNAGGAFSSSLGDQRRH